MITILIQARLGSTRLPNKILMPFWKEKTVLGLLLEKLSLLDGVQVVVATSESPSNRPLIDYLEGKKVNYFAGSEDDVLLRFIDAAQAFSAQKLIRICSDNPFLELESIRQLVSVAENSCADYISFCVDGIPSIKTHFGFWTEYVTLDALQRVRELTKETFYHEHVTNYIYEHPDQFCLDWITVSDDVARRKDIRLTLDTRADFIRNQEIFMKLGGNLTLSIAEVIEFLDQNPYYFEQMKSEIHNNSK